MVTRSDIEIELDYEEGLSKPLKISFSVYSGKSAYELWIDHYADRLGLDKSDTESCKKAFLRFIGGPDAV